MATALPATRSGLDAALHAAMEAEAGRMMALARRMMGNEADAADVVQESWVRAWRNREAWRGEGPAAAWLRAILVRECLRALRWRSLRTWLPVGNRQDDGEIEPGGPAGDQPDAALDAFRVRRFLPKLTPQQRAVVGLRYEEGWTVPEIAASLGLSTETVKTHLDRALTRLRAHLGDRDGS